MALTSHNHRERGEEQTAKVFLTPLQKIVPAIIGVLAILYGILAGPTPLLQIVAALITVFYVVFVGFKMAVAIAGAGHRFPPLIMPSVDDPMLPTYSVLVPMRGETAAGFDRLLAWLHKVNYPLGKLQILFIVDEDDTSTLRMVKGYALPAYMQLVTVSDIGPRTKPKACNFAMDYVTGDRVVIWDFEDRPEPNQLLKAVAALDHARLDDPRVACVQGMLQFWNPRSGVAGVFYWAEYVVHFRWMLTGLARLGFIPPLGGTSNHFLTSALREVARQHGSLSFPVGSSRVEIPNVWDSYNVTEDADLAARLQRCGYSITMGDFVTFEEAPNTLGKAKGQKSRWLKGFIQTFLVQSRRPFRSMREMGVGQYLAYNLFIGGTPLSFLINPIVWSVTVFYIVSRLAGWDGVTLYIESLFPPAIYYPAMTVAIVGNFVLLYQMLLTPLRQQEHESFVHLPVSMQQQQYGLSWRLLVVWLWWIFTTVPAYKGAFELLRRSKRFYWNKTAHSHAADQEHHLLGDTSRPAALPASTATAATLTSTKVDRRTH